MILQRWQTVYMLISVIAMGIAAFFPAMGQLPQGNTIWIQSGKMMVVSSLLCALTAVLLFVAIFKFKNLKFQKQLCSVGQLLIIGYYVVNGIDWYLSPMLASAGDGGSEVSTFASASAATGEEVAFKSMACISSAGNTATMLPRTGLSNNVSSL